MAHPAWRFEMNERIQELAEQANLKLDELSDDTFRHFDINTCLSNIDSSGKRNRSKTHPSINQSFPVTVL